MQIEENIFNRTIIYFEFTMIMNPTQWFLPIIAGIVIYFNNFPSTKLVVHDLATIHLYRNALYEIPTIQM